MSWKVTILGPRASIEAALIAHEDALDWDPGIVIAGSEQAEDRPDDWQFEAWLADEPDAATLAAITALFAPHHVAPVVEQLPDTDWVALSQADVVPIRAGPFHVHTPDFAEDTRPGVIDLVIPVGQAFGTGQHETTAGCLAMLAQMRSSGVVVRNLADVGTGTGLLALAALRLWPRARALASDIDAVCGPVVAGNAAANGVVIGDGPGRLAVAIAPGLDHPLYQTMAPFDLILANILAGPLISLAPDIAAALRPGGHVVLAGLLTSQEAAVRAAMRAAGLRLAARLTHGDWSILWLRRRRMGQIRRGRSPDLA